MRRGVAVGVGVLVAPPLKVPAGVGVLGALSWTPSTWDWSAGVPVAVTVVVVVGLASKSSSARRWRPGEPLGLDEATGASGEQDWQ
jgi:hypothetical protein